MGEVLNPKYELIVVYPGEGQAYPEELISMEKLSSAEYEYELNVSGKIGIKNIEINKIIKIVT